MPDQRQDVATLLLDRLGDQRLGLRTGDQDWTWDEVVTESAHRAALATDLHRSRFPDASLHIGILLPNVADFVFWLGGAALSGATVVASTRPAVTVTSPPTSATPTAPSSSPTPPVAAACPASHWTSS